MHTQVNRLKHLSHWSWEIGNKGKFRGSSYWLNTDDQQATRPTCAQSLHNSGNMTALDSTGIHALEKLSDRLHKTGKMLLLCGARNQPSLLISRSDFLQHLGAENVLPHV